ncbi:formyltransferase family protein [Actinoallomurus sp. CA-150999]|uniref:formyltransferase family protein n=1 Tax=Actinoallomurus sp. CA-150999 TaxID=3239887 RepID=UPI003D928311
MRCVAFVYDFPHWKSWHGIAHLIACGLFSELLAIGAPYVPLEAGASPNRHKTRHIPSGAASSACGPSRARYISAAHDSLECTDILSAFRADIGVILGARALPERVLESADCPILNVHPGVLPQNRGLDAVAWAVQRGWPQGVTVHQITPRLDAGPIMSMAILESLAPSDCIMKIVACINALQLVLLMTTLHRVAAEDGSCRGIEIQHPGMYHSRYYGSDIDLMDRLASYNAAYPNILGKWMREEARLVERLGERLSLVEG